MGLVDTGLPPPYAAGRPFRQGTLLEDRESILGLDNIRLELPIAGVGSRTLAALLDYIVLWALVILWLIVWGVSFSAAGAWVVAVAAAGVFVLEWGYFALSEMVSGGRTLGKKAVKLRVITAEGGTPRPGAFLARNLVRSLDLLFGIPLMAIDPLARRLGDRLAGTLVVHERRRAAAPLLGRMPAGWGPREVAVVESFLAGAEGFDNPIRTTEMANRILERLRRDAPELLAGVYASDPIETIRRALQVEEG
jgi:uncharacterized RDD family membrane protein YckC